MRSTTVFLVGLVAAAVALAPLQTTASSLSAAADDEDLGEQLVREFLPRALPLVLREIGEGTPCYKSVDTVSRMLLKEVENGQQELLEDQAKMKLIMGTVCSLKMSCVKLLGDATKTVMKMPKMRAVVADMLSREEIERFDVGVDQAIQLFQPMCSQFKTDL
jgi:hypothetical protein